MRKIKKFTTAASLLVISFFSNTTNLFAQTTDGVYEDVVTLSWVESIFESLLSMMIQLIGVGAFVMLVYGSFQYLVAGSDAQKVEAAWKTITYAVLGLVLIFGVYFILFFISQVTGNTDILEFNFLISN